ncbi:uncharacterized protein CANTADRAFT_52854 [Suhomyces tanzawaensis NRRL Y-17324]|uniref:Uncharacterized protein n=1 Tax=Suhomyces tanzawaensis NRRL Y-17324 TaxID=984487 RepID=A0A1E4SFW0_9ASCO|nr:uncharacterized protein CANTADRAFT_52854 [Suhomyces tanzawaensis NRRL Y-17324]ODV78366.1 hypothetical protein CANTADRAFT_52854 [Suhomyces tanzawaensis NRRL Y-17324]
MKKTSKRIPGKVIDRFWEPLDRGNLASLDRILNICLTKAMERYEGSKLTAAQRILTHTWTSDNPRSFKSRLNTTKVPLTTTLGKVDDPLSLDQVLRRKTFLETYLLAELKQLSELQKHYQEQEIAYKLDLDYLEELRKTTSIHQMKMDKDTKPLDLEPVKENIGLASTENPKVFDPDTDEDTKRILDSLSKHFKSIKKNTEQLTLFNDRLEVVYNILDVL